MMADADAQLGDHLAVRMENEFDQTLTETDYQKRAKATKAFNRTLKEASPTCSSMYPMQVRFMQMRTNVSFLLECAHNRVSYRALAEDFAEYDFLAREIKKEAKKGNNDTLKRFLTEARVLDTNFFQVMLSTAEVMQKNMLQRMADHPEQYIDLNPEVDAQIDIDEMKHTFKEKQKKLKDEKQAS